MQNKDENIGKVEGLNGSNMRFDFDLSLREVKHIRRCLKQYEHINPPFNDDGLQQGLVDKFMKFGRRKGRRKIFLSPTGAVCSWPGCKEHKNLTKDHVTPLSADGTNKIDNIKWLCVRHHEMKNLQHRIIIKEEQIKVFKKKFKELEDDKVV